MLRLTNLTLLLILIIATARAQTGNLTGAVKDASAAAIVGAAVNLLNARQTVVASTVTDAQGRFTLSNIAPGSYELRVTGARGFAARGRAVRVPTSEAVEIILGFEALTAETTVSAEIGTVQSVARTSQPVNRIDEQKIAERAKAVLAQVAQEEPGLQLQRTSPTIGAIFVRGLTGAKVVNYVDGVRYSTSAMRGGINTFFNLNDASNLNAVEVLRGPNSAQFGSDSIGGTVQLLSRAALYTDAPGVAVHGEFGTHYYSADHGWGGNQLVTFGGRDLAVLVNAFGHRSSTIRPGGGYDTHSAINRFLGLRSDLLIGERSPDTAFTRYGGLLKLNYKFTAHDQLSVYYNRAQIDGGKRFDQTIGGDGNLIADLRNFMLDFFYGRYEHFGAGPFDSASLTYSFNAQREERVNQGGNGNPAGAITFQPERTVVHGVQGQLVKQWSRNDLVFGGEFYYDRVRTDSYTLNPITRAYAVARGRVPDRAQYWNGGIYVQDAVDLIRDRLRLIGALRYNRVAYESRAKNSPLVNGAPLWPDDTLTADAVTPRVGAVVTLVEGLSLSAQVSRGFRAPHITDLATVGLTGNGYEANAADLAGRGATYGSTAGNTAVSTGIPVQQLNPETSWNYEGSIRFRNRRVEASVTGFVNDLYDNIVLQSVILPAGAVGSQLGDQRISSQSASGVVFVPASTNPVLIRANFGDSRIHGIEQKFEAQLSRNWSVGQNFTYLHAEDKRTKLPPTIEGGTPAPQGNLRIRYSASSGRFWIEPYLYGARKQTRLSTLDLDDRRIGAARSRASIANFFTRGATVRGFVAPGADNRFGTADDILSATGETLAQVQTRVLGSAASAPLYTYIPGFLTFGIRGGLRLGERHHVLIDLENLNDKNYRGISWGMDAPGRNLGFRYHYRF